MLFPDYRPRRLRQNKAFRRMIRETELSVNDLILPLFAIGGSGVKNTIDSLPGHYQLSIDNLGETAKNAHDLGIPAIILFGIPEKKDSLATRAYAENGIVQKAVRAVKDKVPELAVITDVCLCQYMDHGHCGVVEGNFSPTIEIGSVSESSSIRKERRKSHGLEVWRAKVIHVSKGFWNALGDIAPDEAYVVAPVKESYPMKGGVIVSPLQEIMAKLQEEYS